MILLTGGTGLIGSRVLARLVARRAPVRCLVRDPRRLGPDRVRVQITLGDLADPSWLRQGLRGVTTVLHLAGSERDQPHTSVEEVDGLAVWRLLRAAEAAGVEHLLFVSALGATPWHRTRVHRAKALAERAVAESALRTTTLRCSTVYAPGDDRLTRLERLALLPAVPLTGRGRARVQPILADDLADCVLAAMDLPAEGAPAHATYELAGPEVVTQRELVDLALRGRRSLLPIPEWALRRVLVAHETLTGPAAVATWSEASFRAAGMTTPRGAADAVALGVRPRAVSEVLAG
ncbi:MAG: NAD(P)H-binding protein [Actinomycetota bacterium]|nr:NAD(P)H-binding protein [Actinomycetota bacterium]